MVYGNIKIGSRASDQQADGRSPAPASAQVQEVVSGTALLLRSAALSSGAAALRMQRALINAWSRSPTSSTVCITNIY